MHLKKITFKNHHKIWFLISGVFLLCYLALFSVGLVRYVGSVISYSLFSFFFLLMFSSGFIRQMSYGYSFLVVMLWLGFWLKLTIHLWLGYSFLESIGQFDGEPHSWDEVLAVATVGSIGVMAGRVVFLAPIKTHRANSTLMSIHDIPILKLYLIWRWQFWLGLAVFFMGIMFINLTLGIIQVGLVPRTILPWPLNALISWLVTYGFLLFFATLLWWDMLLQRDSRFGLYMVAMEGFFSATSLLSRGAYIFHVAPTYLSAYLNKKMLVGCYFNRMLKLGVVAISLFLLSLYLSGIYREKIYSDKPIEEIGISGISGIGGIITRLAVDRWIGLEGLMVVQSNNNKSDRLILEGLMEKREIGKNTMYMEMSRPVYYSVVDKTKFQFTEIPGPVAFWWYSGSLWMVGLGLFFLTIFTLVMENMVVKINKNPILSAVLGGLVANTVAQFGVAPMSSLTQIMVTVVGITLIGLVQSHALGNWIVSAFSRSKHR